MNQCANQWKYEVVEEECYQDELGFYITYGISVYNVKNITLCDVVHDVTLRRQTADEMAKLFEEYQLSPVHLREAIENMLE